MNKQNLPEKFQNFVIFQTKTGKVNIEVFFHNDTIWLTQKKIAELFEKDRSVITKHLKNIFAESELDEKLVCANFAHTTQHGAIEGKTQKTEVKYYNLRAISAVGYRINSHRATEFRKWATEILHEYIIKGFVMDDERLKQIKHFGQDYFDEMLERIREIRLNEEHLKELERIVSAYLDLAENRAKRSIVTNMKDWVQFLDKFLAISDYPILIDKSKISELEAKIKAEGEYDIFRVIQDQNYSSDFDKEVKRITGKEGDK